jgi:hypothetical protein
MSGHLLKETAEEYRRRWQAVHEAEIEEIEQTPLATKLRQLSLLVESRNLFATKPDFSPEDAEVLDRWNRIRRYYGDSSSQRG